MFAALLLTFRFNFNPLLLTLYRISSLNVKLISYEKREGIEKFSLFY
jgi:hypothetical protein